MNVFALDLDPCRAALALHDDLLGSQGGEAVQVLSDAAELQGRWAPWMRQPYNPRGRFARWAASSRHAAAWLVDHGLAVLEEIEFRGHRKPPAGVAEALLRFGSEIAAWPGGPMPPFAMCEASIRVRDRVSLMVGYPTPEVWCYRRMYEETKMAGRSWTRRGPPAWARVAAGAAS